MRWSIVNRATLIDRVSGNGSGRRHEFAAFRLHWMAIVTNARAINSEAGRPVPQSPFAVTGRNPGLRAAQPGQPQANRAYGVHDTSDTKSTLPDILTIPKRVTLAFNDASRSRRNAGP